MIDQVPAEKACSKCEKVQPLTEYHVLDSSQSPAKLRSDCQTCFKARIAAKQSKCRDYQYGYLMDHPCVMCGETDPTVLEFDHLRDKKMGVSQAVGRGTLQVVKDEIEKCQILCANCHRRKTAYDFDWWKFKKHAKALRISDKHEWQRMMIPIWTQEINAFNTNESKVSKLV